MTSHHTIDQSKMTRNLPRAHEWDMIAGFMLGTPVEPSEPDKCMYEPIAATLTSLGLEQALLKEICAAVSQAGEALRAMCPEGKADSVNVRVHVSTQATSSAGKRGEPWAYFITKQIASSEPDTIEEPRCFIDLHIY